MKLLKIGDKVKVIGQESNSAFKLYGRICTICEVGEHYYGLEEEIPLKIDFGGVHHYEVKLVSEYNPTFNPEAHSSLITDFGKDDVIETIEKAAKNAWGNVHRSGVLGFIEGAKSDSARNYWYSQFLKEQEDSIKVSDIRNKLNPITNLITMLENGLIKATVDVHSIIQSELKQCKISIEYLTKQKS